MRKKLLILSMMMTVCLTACGGKDDGGTNNTDSWINGIGAVGNETNNKQNDDNNGNDMSQAEEFLNEKNYDAAIEIYMDIVKKEPENVEAYLGVADAFIGINEFEMAIEQLIIGLDFTGDDRIISKLDKVERLALQYEANNNGDSNNGSSDENETTNKVEDNKEFKLEWNQFSMDEDKKWGGMYVFTYDRDAFSARKQKNATSVWMEFDLGEIQEQFIVEKSEDFESYYKKLKENTENFELNSNITFSEPYAIRCGNVIVWRYDYGMTQQTDKSSEPLVLKWQAFYVDLGGGYCFTGKTSEFIDEEYRYYHDGVAEYITVDEYLEYLFKSVDRLENGSLTPVQSKEYVDSVKVKEIVRD